MSQPADQGEVRQIVIHPAAWEWVKRTFDARGFDLGRLPDMEDDLPTYIMVPRSLDGTTPTTRDTTESEH